MPDYNLEYNKDARLNLFLFFVYIFSAGILVFVALRMDQFLAYITFLPPAIVFAVISVNIIFKGDIMNLVLCIVSLVIGVIITLVQFLADPQYVTHQTVQYIGYVIGSIWIIGGFLLLGMHSIEKNRN